MKLISFIAVVIYANAATGATFKAPVYSIRKNENGIRSKSSQIMMDEGNAKSPYHSPRMQQLLRPDTGKTPLASWGNEPHGGKDGTGLSYLSDIEEWVQITTLEVGTPPQSFRMLLSISDAGMFLPSPRCNASCWMFQQYKSSQSSTYVPNGTHLIVQYGRLDAFAIASADTLHFAGLELPNMTFGEAREAFLRRTPEIGDWEWDGELGLAPSEKVSNPFPYFGPRFSTAMENPFLNMASRGVLDRNIFGLKLSRGEDDPGEIMFGDVNHDLYEGELKTLHLLDDSSDWSSAYGRWNVPATSFSVGNGSISLEGWAASLDSDFPLIALPQDLVMLLENELGLNRPNRYAPSSMDCSKRDEAQDLIITLGEHEFVISAYEYTIEFFNRPQFGGHRCISAFRPSWSGGFHEKYIHLGSAFLRGFYGVFDLDERTVSLAKLKEKKIRGPELRRE